jgi:hypothetical protein
LWSLCCFAGSAAPNVAADVRRRRLVREGKGNDLASADLGVAFFSSSVSQ